MNVRIDNRVEELPVDECWALLRSQVVGRLGISILNRPDIFPVNYVVDHGTIVFRTAEGTKFAAAVLGAAVVFEIDHYDAARGQAWSVVTKGHAAEVEGMHELFRVAELPLFPWHDAPKFRFVCIVPNELSGRRFFVDPTSLTAPRDAPQLGQRDT